MCRRVEKSRSTSGKGFLFQIATVRGSLEQSERSSSNELPDYVSSSPYRWCCEISPLRGTSHFTSFVSFCTNRIGRNDANLLYHILTIRTLPTGSDVLRTYHWYVISNANTTGLMAKIL